ncbi:MAG: tetratricopeptide repeat protein [Pseudomonadota bacterium]
MADPQASVFRFADFELDIKGRQLVRGGDSLAMEPRVFDLLAYLVTNRDRAVSKDELQDALWAPMIVTETALTRAVGKARKAIGDDANQQSMIRTVHGHGYQFVGELQHQAEDDPVADSATEAEPQLSRPARMRWPLGIAALAVLSLVGVLLLWPSHPPAGGIRLAIMPVQNQTGDPELDWVRYGMMDLANQLFVDNDAITVVASSDIAKFSENRGWAGESDPTSLADVRTRLARAYGATHILIAVLERNVGGLRLSYLLLDANGRRREATMVSEQSASLAHGMVQGVTGLLGFRRYDDTLSAVDDDPFINEAYARAINKVLEGKHAEALPLLDVVLGRNPALHLARIHRAECLFILGQVDASEVAYRELTENLEIQAQPGLHARSLTGLAKVIHETGRLSEAEPIYQRSLAVAEAGNELGEVGRVLISMSILDYDRRDFSAARDKLNRSTLAFRRLERDILPGQIYSSLANIAMNDGRLSEAEDNVLLALESFRAVGDRRNEALILNNYGYLRRLQGRFKEALVLHEQSLALRRELGDRVGQGRILGMLSTLYDRDGRHQEARDAAHEAVEIARSANDMIYVAAGLSQLAAADRALGNIEAARVAFEESRAVFVGIEDHSRAAQVDLRLAELLMIDGDLESADTMIEAVLGRSLESEWPTPAVEAMSYAGDLALQREQTSSASSWYRRAFDYAGETGLSGEKIDIAIKLANVHLDLGQPNDVEPLLGFLVEQESTAEIEAVKSRYQALISTAQ